MFAAGGGGGNFGQTVHVRVACSLQIDFPDCAVLSLMRPFRDTSAEKENVIRMKFHSKH